MKTVRWILMILVVLVILALPPTAQAAMPTDSAAAAAGVRFESLSFSDAQAKARQENRPLLVDLFADT
jgi:predicted O-linked N-acetylglucosamine transferase (SPINDLY family)